MRLAEVMDWVERTEERLGAPVFVVTLTPEQMLTGDYSNSPHIHETREYKTKNGLPITFSIKMIDYKHDNPWVVYEIDASVQGEQVGYLKISFIPTYNWKKFYPTLWHYAFRSGWSIDYEFLEALSPNKNEWTSEQKMKLLQSET